MLVEVNFRYLNGAKHLLGESDQKALAKLWSRLKEKGKGKFKQFYYNVGPRKFKVEFDRLKVNPNYSMPLDEFGYYFKTVTRIVYFYKVSLMGDAA